jgi:hypothetical protein
MSGTAVSERSMTANKLREALGGFRFRYAHEEQLQEGIAAALEKSGISFSREVKLTARDRIDFMVSRVGIEVKVGHPLASVMEQLHRYVQSSDVDGLLLVTNRCRHAIIPEVIGGKPVAVLFLGWGTL